MSSEKHFRLIRKLSEQTSKGNLEWEDSAEGGVFQVVFPDYTVKLSRRPSKEFAGESDYVLTIANQEGETIEEIVDTAFSDQRGREAYQLLRDMYDTARRYSLGVEQALDKLLQHLTDDDDLPF